MFKKFDVISVIIFILLIDCFFYFGTTVNDPKSGSIQMIVLIVQITSGLATVMGVIFACKSYNDWNSRVTHPDKYKKDCETVEKLDEIHNVCRSFSDMYGFRIEHIFNEFESMIERKDDYSFELRELDVEWKAMCKNYKESLTHRLYRDFLNNVFENSADVFDCIEDTPVPLVKYRCVLQHYLIIADLICRTPLHKSRVQHLPYLYSGVDMMVSDLCVSGKAFIDLDDARKEVKDYYRGVWS